MAGLKRLWTLSIIESHNDFRKLSIMSIIKKAEKCAHELMQGDGWKPRGTQGGFRKGKSGMLRVWIQITIMEKAYL